MNNRTAVEQALIQNAAPPTLQEEIFDVLISHINKGDNIFTASLSYRWLDVLNHTKSETYPKVLAKMVKSLLEINEDTNKQLLKLPERSNTGIKIIVNDGDTFLSDIKATKN